MKKARRPARWHHRHRNSVIELTLPRQVTPTRAPGDAAQSMTILLFAPVGVESAVLTAAMLQLGAGRVLRVPSRAALRQIVHPPTDGDFAIVRSAPWYCSRRLHRKLRQAGWSDVIICADGVTATDILETCARLVLDQQRVATPLAG